MNLPGLIIFINNDFNDITKNLLSVQLNLDEIITKAEFDSRVIDPNYVQLVHNFMRRVLVLLPTLQDTVNRDLADIVCFYKQGQISVEKCKYGPPGQSYIASKITIYQLINANSNQVVSCGCPKCYYKFSDPFSSPKCGCCNECPYQTSNYNIINIDQEESQDGYC
jgi:hypothetical protein